MNSLMLKKDKKTTKDNIIKDVTNLLRQCN